MKQGSYRMSMAEYQACPCPEPSLSRGTIISLLDCPKRAWQEHPKLNPPDPDTEEQAEAKFDAGTVAHSMLLEGEDIAMVIDPRDFPGAKGAIPKGWTTDAIRAARDAVRSVGKIPLLPKQYQAVVGMVKAAQEKIARAEDFTIKDLRTEGDAELSYFWKEGDIWCQCRPDWISKFLICQNRKLCIDYKTSGTSANPGAVSGHIGKMRYDIQEAFYRRGVKAVDGVDCDFVFLFQEDEPPYLCSWVSPDHQYQQMADEQVEWGISKWRECLATRKWDEYPDKICYAEPKPWELAAWAMKQFSMGIERTGEL